MDLFSCYDIFPDEKTKKRAMEIEAIAYRRNKAVENKIRLAKAAIENHNMEMAYAAMNIDTTLAEILDRMDPMALKDIFTMVKADKYTADGREELSEKTNAIGLPKKDESAEKPQNSHPMVGQRFDPKQKETEMKWADGQTHTTYSMKDGEGNREEGTRRALVVREDEHGQGVYGVINYDKRSGKINYMKEYDDEREADRAFDTLMAQRKKHLHDSASRILTGDTKIRVRKA